MQSFFKIWLVVKFLIQNLTLCIFSTQNLKRCIFLKSKYDALCFFKFKIWRVVIILFKIWRVGFFFNSQSVTKRKCQFKIMLFKKARKMQICRFHGVRRTKTWLFWMQTFFKIWLVENFLIQNLTLCVFFQFKNWRVGKTSNQNLTRCGNFKSKTDKFQNFFSEIWFLSCFSGSDWLMISSVNVNTNLF